MNKKQLVEKYLKLSLWYLINANDKDQTLEIYTKVAKVIGETEDALRNLGATDKSINVLLDHVHRIKDSKIEDLKPSEQLFLCKVIFGDGCKWSEEPNEK